MPTCPKCKGWVAARETGALFPHKRYADGAGFGRNQPHDLIECEGSNKPPVAEKGK